MFTYKETYRDVGYVLYGSLRQMPQLTRHRAMCPVALTPWHLKLTWHLITVYLMLHLSSVLQVITQFN